MAAAGTGMDATVEDFLDTSPRRAGSTRSQDLRLPPGLETAGEVPAQLNEPVETTPAARDLSRNEPDLSPPRWHSYGPTWRCLQCDSDAWEERERALWVCLICGSDQFYDSTTPTRRESTRGVWMYMPHPAPPDPSASSTSETASTSTLPGPWSPSSSSHRRRRPPSEPSAGEWDEARAESEAATLDATVDPDTLQPVPRLSRRQRRAAAAASQRPQEPRPPQVPRSVLPEPPGVRGEGGSGHGGWPR